jgi:L,D-transpeptidase YcbB
MRKRFTLFVALALCSAAPAPQGFDPGWTAQQREQLSTWLKAAPLEGLQVPVRAEPRAQALELAKAILLGNSEARTRAKWNIADGDQAIDLEARLAAALAQGDLDGFFTGLRPRNPQYEALRLALRAETDPGRRTQLLRNLERWRWMPLDMGPRYLLVNAPGFELGLWEHGRKIGQWRVITGKPKTPTPVFSARVSGVIVNPWWDVPPSIVAESVGALVRRNPAEARRRGYVWGGGTYRQRPGPGNALGQMKLVMPNPYKVYLHDTPNKALFEQPVRAFSHGCIRVDQALGFAATLLGRPVDGEVKRGRTITLPLSDPLPVYVTYFTADVGANGTVEFHDDIYGRDASMSEDRNLSSDCSG